MARRKLTREQAIIKLRETRTLSTDLLEPLGIKLDSFLRLAQLPKERADETVAKLIASFGAA